MEKELVWAKVRGLPSWPGKICTAKANLIKYASKPKGGHPWKLIFFFGSKKYIQVEDSNLKPYLEYRESIVKEIKNKLLREAVKRIDEYLSDPEKYKANADWPCEEEENEHTRTAFNKLLRVIDESSELKTTTKTKSSTKKPTSKRKADEALTSHSISISQTQKLQNIVVSAKTFGFLGVGIMGSGILKNLLNSGHKVIIWNPDPSKSKKLEDLGAKLAMTPCDVAKQVDVIFSCMSDLLMLKELVFGNCGIISSIQHFDGKGYVEMTGLDGNTSQFIADAIVSKGGRYLEAPIQGSRLQAEEGTLIIPAAGDRSLFDECRSCFDAMGKNSFFLGDVGKASKMYLMLQLFSGITMGGLAEVLALADRFGLPTNDVLEVLALTPMASPYIIEKGKAIIHQAFHIPHHPLTHMQQDLRLGLALSEQIQDPIPITTATNEVFKRAKRNGYADHDVAAVFVTSRL